MSIEAATPAPRRGLGLWGGAIATGIGAAIAVFVVSIGQALLFGAPQPDTTDPTAANGGIDAFRALRAVTVAPLLETLLFVLLLAGFKAIRLRAAALHFVVVVTIFGWWAHGVGVGLDQAVGFMVLALWCAQAAKRADYWDAYWSTSLAHATWNALLLGPWALGQLWPG